MIIVPERSPNITNPEVIPIRMILETRMDALALYLRVLRYLGQKGAWGENLRWSDDPESPGIYIAKYSSNSIGKDANPLPAILVGIGGYQTGEQFLTHSAVDIDTYRGTTKMTMMNTNISISVRGQNEQQTYMIADTTSLLLDNVKPEITAAALNLDYMSGISVGPVNKLTDPSGNPYLWECNMSFSVSIRRFYVSKNYTGLRTPDPATDSGSVLYLGQAGEVGQYLFQDNKRPMFALADFKVTIEGDTSKGEEPEVTVFEQSIFQQREF